jgi:hypothetical protein
VLYLLLYNNAENLFTIEANELIQRFPDNARPSVQVLIWYAALTETPRISHNARPGSRQTLAVKIGDPVPKTINGNRVTGTKQLLGHFYRLLDLLRQMLDPCRSNPTNSTGKKPYRDQLPGAQRSYSNAFVFERIPPSPRSLNSSLLNHQIVFVPQPPSSERSSSNVLVIVQSGAKLVDNLFVCPNVNGQLNNSQSALY